MAVSLYLARRSTRMASEPEARWGGISAVRAQGHSVKHKKVCKRKEGQEGDSPTAKRADHSPVAWGTAPVKTLTARHCNP